MRRSGAVAMVVLVCVRIVLTPGSVICPALITRVVFVGFMCAFGVAVSLTIEVGRAGTLAALVRVLVIYSTVRGID